MGFVTAAIAVVGAALTISSIHQQKKQAKNMARIQDQKNLVETGRAAVENRDRRRRMIAAQMQQRARIENLAAQQGGGGASTTMASGALGSNTTTGALNLADFGEQMRLGGRANDLTLAYGVAQGKSNNAQAMGSFGQFMMGNASTFGGQIEGFMKGGAPSNS